MLQLKVTLVGSQPSVWRSIAVVDQSMFFDLHIVIQDAFGWTDSHLHQFFTANPFKRNSLYEQIGFPMEGDDEDKLDERNIALSKYLHAPGNQMWYEYDFGDSWMHEISLEKILQPEHNATYPQILSGAGAIPPEDCGGIGGYAHLLDVLAHTKNPEHKNMLEWLGIDKPEEFHTENFNPNHVRFRDPKKALKAFEKQFKL